MPLRSTGTGGGAPQGGGRLASVPRRRRGAAPRAFAPRALARVALALALVALAAALGPRAAWADEPPVAIDVRDLPPLPRLATEAPATAVAVAAAADADEDVVVSAAKREQSLGDVASAVTVISGDRLRRFGYRTVSEALRAAAGLFVVDDHQTERLGLRGLQLLGDYNTRILVLVDGATVNEPFNQYAGIALDMPLRIDDVDRIEIIRGPVSSVYGTNAFFGIINIVTRGADKSPRAWGRLDGGTLETFAGTAGFAVGGLQRQVRGSASYGVRGGDTASIALPAGPVPLDGVDGLDAWTANLVGQWDGFFAQVRGFHHARDLTYAPYDTRLGDPGNRNFDDLVLGEVGYSRDVGRASLTARAYASTYQFRDTLVYDPDPGFNDEARSTWAGGEVRGLVRLLPRDRLLLTAGTEVARNDVVSRSWEDGAWADRVEVESPFTTLGAYTEAQAALWPWLSVTGGLRLDVRLEDSEEDANAHLSPRAGLLFSRATVGAKLLYAEGFRYPSPIEADFEDGVDFIANPALRPERIRSVEAVGWARPRPGLSLRLSGFRWALADLIEQDEVTTPDGPRIQFQNLSTATSTGVEVEALHRTTSGWLAFVGGTLARVELNSEAAPNAPLVVAQAGASTPRLRGLVHVSTELHFLSARRTRDPGGLEADPHLRWDVAVHAPDLAGRFGLTIGARNLLGIREEIPAQEDYDREDGTVPVYLLDGTGRELYARLAMRY